MFSILLAAAVALSPVKQPTSVADPILTPGVVRTDLTLDQIKATKWGLDRRLVSARMKAEVYARYGFSGPHDLRCTPNPKDPRRTCEVDHRVPRCAGGADDIANLSPQPYGGDYNAHQKDRVEVKVCRMLIHDQIALMDGDLRRVVWRDGALSGGQRQMTQPIPPPTVETKAPARIDHPVTWPKATHDDKG
jgi:hypothetical protein